VLWTLLDVLGWLFIRIEPTGIMPKSLTTNNVRVTNLKDTVAAALAHNVEYRVHEIIQMTYREDINNALCIHNID
ncbi:4602_t:CDS:2, partial [Funneliformis caledonium]